MSTTTTNLGLTKPAFGEFYDSWDDVANANYDLIDAAVGALQTLTVDAAGAAGTINQRFLNVESEVDALDELNDMKAGWVEGVPAAGAFLGPADATLGQSNGARALHSMQLQLAELTGVATSLDVDAGLAARLQMATQGILSGAAGTLLSHGDTTHVRVNPAGDFEVLVNGVLGIIRGGSDESLEAGTPTANARYYVGAESVGSEAVAGNTDGSTSSSTFTGTFTGTGIRAGDLYEITAGDDELVGLYVIASIGAGTGTIRGTFPKNVSGTLSFQFHKRKVPTLALWKWNTDINKIINGVAYTGSTRVGTVLGHATLTAGSIFDIGINPHVQHVHGLAYDSGWQSASGFFDGADLAVTPTVETLTLPLPDIPSSFQFLWSADADGDVAIPVPLEENGNAFGVRQWWNKNVLSVLVPDSNDVLQDENGDPVVLGTVNGGYFRIIARG